MTLISMVVGVCHSPMAHDQGFDPETETTYNEGKKDRKLTRVSGGDEVIT